jgi:hypothetical protein
MRRLAQCGQVSAASTDSGQTRSFELQCERGNYSAISIEWLEHMMSTERIFIQHAENNEEYEVTLYKPSGDQYKKKVDGMIV